MAPIAAAVTPLTKAIRASIFPYFFEIRGGQSVGHHHRQTSIVDVPTLRLAVASVVILWRLKKVQEPVIVAGAAIIGLIIYPYFIPDANE
jgi:hypothetical protein